MMRRIKQLEEDTKIAVTYVAYCIYLISSVVVFFASLTGAMGALIGIMMFFVSSVGIVLCLSILWKHRERLRELEIILPTKVQRKINKKRRKREHEEDDIFG